MRALTRCDRCLDPVDDIWPVVVRRRVELRCAMCAEGQADVPPAVARTRVRERMAKVAAIEPHLWRR